MDAKTKNLKIVANSESSPLLKGQFITLASLSSHQISKGGIYRLKAPSTLFGFFSGPTRIQQYDQRNPLFIGGIAITRVNSRSDIKKFDPLFTLPPKWVPLVVPAVNEKRRSVPSNLRSANALVSFSAARSTISSDNSEFDDLKSLIVESQGLKKAVLLGMMLDSQARNAAGFNSEDGLKEKSLAAQIVSKASRQDLEWILLSLKVSGVTRTHDYFDRKPISRFSAVLLGLAYNKAKLMNSRVPATGRLNLILSGFQIGTRK